MVGALVSCYFKFCVLFLFLGLCLVNGKHCHIQLSFSSVRLVSGRILDRMG